MTESTPEVNVEQNDQPVNPPGKGYLTCFLIIAILGSVSSAFTGFSGVGLTIFRLFDYPVWANYTLATLSIISAISAVILLLGRKTGVYGFIISALLWVVIQAALGKGTKPIGILLNLSFFALFIFLVRPIWKYLK